VAHRLLGQPRTEELVVGITAAQPEQHAVMTPLVEAFVTGEQELADPIERVSFAAAMAQRLVLDAPAHLVDATVGDSHDMKRVGDTDRMVEVWGGAAAITLGQVGGDDTDGSQPGRVLLGAPSAQVNRRVALHQVDDPLAVQIDQPGHVDGPVLGRGREERGLVDAEGSDSLHSPRVLDQWGAVEDHGVHHGPPAHPELAGHDSDREGELSDLAGGFRSGTQREHSPWCDVLSALGPRLSRAVGVDTAPAPLEPDESCWATEAREIPDVDPDTVLGLGARTAGRTSHEV